MNESKRDFREQLLGAEQLTPSYREKYEKEVHAMIEKKLTGVRKWSHIGGLIMGLGFTVLFGTMAVIAPKGFPLWCRFGFAAGAVFGLAFAGFSAWILKKGTINLKKDTMIAAGLGWGFIMVFATLVLVYSGRLPDPITGVRMLAAVLVYEVAAAAMLLRVFIERSELNTREKLLEIEYRLAGIAEGITKQEQR